MNSEDSRCEKDTDEMVYCGFCKKDYSKSNGKRHKHPVRENKNLSIDDLKNKNEILSKSLE